MGNSKRVNDDQTDIDRFFYTWGEIAARPLNKIELKILKGYNMKKRENKSRAELIEELKEADEAAKTKDGIIKVLRDMKEDHLKAIEAKDEILMAQAELSIENCFEQTRMKSEIKELTEMVATLSSKLAVLL